MSSIHSHVYDANDTLWKTDVCKTRRQLSPTISSIFSSTINMMFVLLNTTRCREDFILRCHTMRSMHSKVNTNHGLLQKVYYHAESFPSKKKSLRITTDVSATVLKNSTSSVLQKFILQSSESQRLAKGNPNFATRPNRPHVYYDEEDDEQRSEHFASLPLLEFSNTEFAHAAKILHSGAFHRMMHYNAESYHFAGQPLAWDPQKKLLNAGRVRFNGGNTKTGRSYAGDF